MARRRPSSAVRILHAPTSVAGLPWALAQGERALGHDSRVAVIDPNWMRYPHDEVIFTAADGVAARQWKKVRYLLGAVRRFDAFHFNFGRSILDFPEERVNLLDLPLLKAAGKPLVFTFMGCDVKQRTYWNQRFAIRACGECENAKCDLRHNRNQQKRIRRIERWADRAFALNPDLRHVAPYAEYLPYAIDPARWSPSGAPRREGPFRILHAPSNRVQKGTRHLLAAVERLKARHDLELVLVEKVPNDQVKPLYEQADLVVDQLLYGWYGTFAAECMMLGKPVMAYIREEDLGLVPRGVRDRLPILRTTPQSIEQDLAHWLENPGELRRVGEASRAYALDQHDHRRVAARVLEAYRN